MTPTQQRQQWLDQYGIDIWAAQAMAQLQGLLPEFERAMHSRNIALLRGMERLCKREVKRQ